ncbi:alpha/beta hydrolase family protein [Corynebacterium sp.]|uniref:alpha/beta hydrolase n=1 Tax=Corynebacterium sp. TaxID=1720 RepID=UPI0026E0D66D|nr:alpha/beta hydrolase family protein [Corynebacterium sp.]MDO5511785.1 alpha/beta hydrolase family protein [Corynebacterium sp.]
MSQNRCRRVVALSAATTLAVTLIPAAQAQEESSSDGSMRDAVVSSFEDPASSGSSLDAALSSLSLIGSSQWALPDMWREPDDNYPLPTVDTIDAVELVEIQQQGERLERWVVASPSMKRNVEVQIWHSADRTVPAPMLYMLDGVDAPRGNGWLGSGTAREVFAEENVTLVMPTQARGSNYSDWVAEDPALGVHMWETFIVEELAPLLESSDEFTFNGKRGIGGLSMGANGAVHLANTNPELFDGVFGISGCYSPMSPVGRQMASFVVTSRNGDLDNMWGPYGSEEWIRHDAARNPEGLRDQAVYLSAADGTVTPEEQEFYQNYEITSMAVGGLLERGVLTCTQELDSAMQAAGMDHHVVNYKQGGAHNWIQFNQELQPAWDHIKPALDVTD